MADVSFIIDTMVEWIVFILLVAVAVAVIVWVKAKSVTRVDVHIHDKRSPSDPPATLEEDDKEQA
jgi:nitric oxide reductase large subunit